VHTSLGEVDNFYATLLSICYVPNMMENLLTTVKVIVKKTFGLLFCGHNV